MELFTILLVILVFVSKVQKLKYCNDTK